MSTFPLETAAVLGLDGEWTGPDASAPAISWCGADTVQWHLDDTSGALIAKAARAHVTTLPGAGGHARALAHAAGVGPEVLAVSVDGHASVERALDPRRWRRATLADVRDHAVVAAIGRARAAVREQRPEPAASVTRDLRADVEHLAGLLTDRGESLHPALSLVLSDLDRWADALAGGPDPRFGWMSSEISDVMVGVGAGGGAGSRSGGDPGAGFGSDSASGDVDGGPSHGIRLTGGTAAGWADPLADVGALLTEVAPYALPSDVAFVALWGDDHPGAFARARLWGALVDLRAALWAQWARSHGMPAASDYLLRRTWRLRLFLTDDLDTLLTRARSGWC